MASKAENIEKTQGYQIAISFKPFIDPKCTEHIEIVKDFGKTINRALEAKDIRLNYVVSLVKRFENGERVQIEGLTYIKGVNDIYFYEKIKN